MSECLCVCVSINRGDRHRHEHGNTVRLDTPDELVPSAGGTALGTTPARLFLVSLYVDGQILSLERHCCVSAVRDIFSLNLIISRSVFCPVPNMTATQIRYAGRG